MHTYIHTYIQVSVTWEVTLNTASETDINSLKGTDSIPAGSNSSVLSLQVFDDLVSEFSELLSIRLTSVSGGAILGSVVMATVNILPSDDPNGLFGL